MGLQNDLNRAVSIYGAGRVISGGSVMDQAWQADLFRNWAGLSVYRQLTGPLITKYTNFDGKNNALSHDLGKTLSIIVVSSLLEGVKMVWSRLMIVVVGTIVYHYLVREQLVKAASQAIDQASMDWIEDWTENILIMMMTDFVQGNSINIKDGLEQLVGLGVYYHLLKTE